jgi:hypothetical protein
MCTASAEKKTLKDLPLWYRVFSVAPFRRDANYISGPLPDKFQVILLHWESLSYLLDNVKPSELSDCVARQLRGERSASHMSSLSEPGCPTVSLQGHVVGLAGSKFSLVTFLYIKKVSLQGHGVGPGGSLFLYVLLKKIFYQKEKFA